MKTFRIEISHSLPLHHISFINWFLRSLIVSHLNGCQTISAIFANIATYIRLYLRILLAHLSYSSTFAAKMTSRALARDRRGVMAAAFPAN